MPATLHRPLHLSALQSEEIEYGRPARWAHRRLTLTYKAISRLNCSRRKKPEIRSETRDLLKYLYEERNAGLGELIGEDLSEVWPVTDPGRRRGASADGARPSRELAREQPRVEQVTNDERSVT